MSEETHHAGKDLQENNWPDSIMQTRPFQSPLRMLIDANSIEDPLLVKIPLSIIKIQLQDTHSTGPHTLSIITEPVYVICEKELIPAGKMVNYSCSGEVPGEPGRTELLVKYQ